MNVIHQDSNGLVEISFVIDAWNLGRCVSSVSNTSKSINQFIICNNVEE